MDAPKKASLSTQTKALFGITPQEIPPDPGGNFMQTSGMTYAFDLTKPIGNRISNLQLKSAHGFVPIEANKEYSVLMRFHAIDKWHKQNVFGTDSLEATYEHIRHQEVPVSQVDLIGDYIQDKLMDPQKFSAVDGRILDLTPPKPGDLPLKLGSYVAVTGALAAQDPAAVKRPN